MRQITFAPTFTAWQTVARKALADNLSPDEVIWEELGHDEPALALFDESDFATPQRSRFRVPKAFVESARRVACHRDPRRWAILYRLLWRITHSEARLLENVVDPTVHEFLEMDKAIRHDVHKMRAFVRFRAVQHEGVDWYVAWFEPKHFIVELNAPFFRDRFAAMHWSILTPDRCVHWDGEQLSFTEGAARSEAPVGDEVEALWINYYSHIFNPARVKVQAMQSEMPKRYWKNLPEAAVIPALLNEAPKRVEKMIEASAAKTVPDEEYSPARPPETDDWQILRDAASHCQSCPLWRDATQTVFGEGPLDAPLVLVGEQPGDREDREGRPFAGPAGQLLDRALADAGIDRTRCYVTNAVKHFKWTPRAKLRLHRSPNAREMSVCRPWFAAEMRIVQPRVLLCLGATAAKSIVGPSIRVLQDRGRAMVTPYCDVTLVTIHPSSLLRTADSAAREIDYARFVDDLRKAGELVNLRG